MPYTVGSASVTIVPSTKGFAARLKSDLSSLKLDLPIDIDGQRLRDKVKEKTKEIPPVKLPVDVDAEKARAKIAAAVKSQVANIRVDADTRFAQVKVEDLKAQLKDATVRLDVDTARAEARIKAVEALIAETKARLVVDVDDADAKARLEALQHELGDLRTRVDADTAPAKAKVAALRAEIASRDANINVDANTGGAEAKIAGLGGAAGGAGGQISGLVLAGLAIAPAIVPAAAAATGALLGIGAGAIAGAAGVGVLVLGLSGIVSAVTAVVKAQQSSAGSAAANAAAQVASAQRIEAAQSGLKSAETALANARASAADAARRSAQAVQQAQQGVRQATQQAAQGVAQAVAQEATAERSLQAALQQEVSAQKALSDARKQAKRDLEDLTNSVADGALAQRQAAIDVENTKAALDKLGPTQLQIEQATTRTALAQQRYTALLTNPKATQAQRDAAKAALDAATATQQQLQATIGGSKVQREQAQLDYDQAIQHQKKLALQQGRLVDQQKTAHAVGINGATGVVAAQQNLAQAHQGVADAHQNVAAAQQAVTQARLDGVQKIAAAEQALANAEAARTSQARQSASSIAQAAQGVANAQRSLRGAYTQTGTTAAKAGDQAKEALAKLTPEGRRLADFITGSIVPGFKQLSSIAQAPISGGILAGLHAAAPLFPVIKTLVHNLAVAFGDLFDQAGKALGGPFWVNFVRLISGIGAQVIGNLGTIVGNVVTGLAGIFTTFEPIGAAIGGWLIQLSAKFRDFGTGSGIKRFFDYVQQVGPLVAATFGSLFGAVGHIVVALAPLGTTVLGWIKGFADWVRRIPTAQLGKVAGAIIGVAGAAQGLSLASGAFAAIGGAVAAIATPAGVVALAIGAVVGEFALLYYHSKVFRDFVNKELVPELRSAASWLWDHLKPAFHAVWDLVDKYVVPTLIGLTRNALAGARAGFDIVTKALERNRPEVDKVWAAFKQVYEFVWTRIIPLFGPILKAALEYIGHKIATFVIVVGTIIDVFDAVHRYISRLLGTHGTLTQVFDNGVWAIGQAWGKLKALAKEPIRFIVETVIENGLLAAFRSISHLVGFGAGENFHVGLPKGFDRGGWTGPGPREKPAGVVHADEFVINKASRRKIEAEAPGYLDALNGYSVGGLVTDTNRRFRPVKGGRIVQGIHDVSTGFPAIDIAVPVGTDVAAAASGKVTVSRDLRGFEPRIAHQNGFRSYGRYIVIDSGAFQTLYAHLSQRGVNVGQQVGGGQRIGLSGLTGHTYGPHLHFGAHGISPLAFVGGSTHFTGAVGNTAGAVDTSGFLGGIRTALGGLAKLGSSPFAQMIGGIPRKIAGSIESKITDLARSFVIGTADPKTGFGTTGTNRERGRKLMLQYHFPDSQWPFLDKLWNRESGWNERAQNPSSGAYGIPQALPGVKMASVGADWRVNPNTQIMWGLKYIKDRYGSPSGAWAHETSAGWYDRGGWLQPGTTVVTNNTGRPEPVFTGDQFDRMVAGRGGQSLTVNGNVYGDNFADQIFDEWDRRDRRAAVRHNLTSV